MSLGDIFDTLKTTAPVKLLEDAVGNIGAKLFAKPAGTRTKDQLRAEVSGVSDPTVKAKIKEQEDREDAYAAGHETENARKARAISVAAENKGQLRRSAKNSQAMALIDAMIAKSKGGGFSADQLKKDTTDTLKILEKNKTVISYLKSTKKEEKFASLEEVEKSHADHIAALNQKLDGIDSMTVFDYLALKHAAENIAKVSDSNLEKRLEKAKQSIQDDENLVSARRYALAAKLCEMDDKS